MNSFPLKQLALALASALHTYASATDVVPTAEVKVNGQYDPRRDDTASKIIISRQEIEKFGDSNILDVLKRLPGVTVSGNIGFGRGAEIRMRGLGSGYTQLLVDGERAPAGFSIENLNPAAVERIELVRAASAEFSTQGIAGTINIVLKRTVSTANREIKLGTGGGSGGQRTPSANLQISDKVGQSSYSVAANLLSNSFDRDQPTKERGLQYGIPVFDRNISNVESGRFDGFNVTPRLNFKLDNGDTIASNTFVNAARFKRSIDTRTTFGSYPEYPFVGQQTWFDEKFVRSDIVWGRKLRGEAKLEVKVGASYSDNSNGSEWRGSKIIGQPSFTSFVESTGIDKTASTTGRYTNSFMSGHILGMGWDFSWSGRDDHRAQRESSTTAAPVENSDEFFDADIRRAAAYMQDEWTLTPNLSIYAGARWEGIHTQASGTTFSASKSKLSVLSPIFQTLYKLPERKGDQLRFALARTFKAPGTRQLIPRRISSVNNSALDPDNTGNPSLKAERAIGADASYERRLSATGALISVAASYRRIQDVIRQVLFLGPDGRWVVRPINDGVATTGSLELEAKLPLKMIWTDGPPVDLRAAVARNWSRTEKVPGPGNRLAEQTPFTFNVGADYKQEHYSVGANYSVRGGGFVQISPVQARYQRIRRELEAYALWKLSQKTQLRVTGSMSNSWSQQGEYEGDSNFTLARIQLYPKASSARLIIEHKF